MIKVMIMITSCQWDVGNVPRIYVCLGGKVMCESPLAVAVARAAAGGPQGPQAFPGRTGMTLNVLNRFRYYVLYKFPEGLTYALLRVFC